MACRLYVAVTRAKKRLLIYEDTHGVSGLERIRGILRVWCSGFRGLGLGQISGSDYDAWSTDPGVEIRSFHLYVRAVTAGAHQSCKIPAAKVNALTMLEFQDMGL